MAQKLIKINTDHYVVVDDSEIKKGNWFYNPATKEVLYASKDMLSWNNDTSQEHKGWKKITHSTQPLEEKQQAPTHTDNGVFINFNSQKVYDKVKELSLQEVKELIGEVDVEKKAESKYPKSEFWVGSNPSRLYDENAKDRRCFLEGYNQALEDNKEKIAMFICKYLGAEKHSRVYDIIIKDWEQSLQPKTEWEVEIVDGKLKLKL